MEKSDNTARSIITLALQDIELKHYEQAKPKLREASLLLLSQAKDEYGHKKQEILKQALGVVSLYEKIAAIIPQQAPLSLIFNQLNCYWFPDSTIQLVFESKETLSNPTIEVFGEFHDCVPISERKWSTPPLTMKPPGTYLIVVRVKEQCYETSLRIASGMEVLDMGI